jgi:uncharacterized Zn finger protein (UPF0148 family)
VTAAAALLAFFCDRCGSPFWTPSIQLECPSCVYAVHPYRVVLGYGRRTPLIRPVGVA